MLNCRLIDFLSGLENLLVQHTEHSQSFVFRNFDNTKHKFHLPIHAQVVPVLIALQPLLVIFYYNQLWIPYANFFANFFSSGKLLKAFKQKALSVCGLSHRLGVICFNTILTGIGLSPVWFTDALSGLELNSFGHMCVQFISSGSLVWHLLYFAFLSTDETEHDQSYHHLIVWSFMISVLCGSGILNSSSNFIRLSFHDSNKNAFQKNNCFDDNFPGEQENTINTRQMANSIKKYKPK